MVNTWIIALIIYLATTLIVVLLTAKKYRKKYKERMWKIWGMRTWYWQEVILMSTVLTFLILMLLKWVNILTF